MLRTTLVCALGSVLVSTGIAEAQIATSTIEEIIVEASLPTTVGSAQIVRARDLMLRPRRRPADTLEVVPGLEVVQHAGGGKANQYFIRGFDADHGTDIALFVDGLPVNLRSHAHGQGYADLHFLIPEVLRQVDVYKGPYFVEFGDFATAAAINFITADTVPENVVEAAGGNWGTQRYLTLLSPTRDRSTRPARYARRRSSR